MKKFFKVIEISEYKEVVVQAVADSVLIRCRTEFQGENIGLTPDKIDELIAALQEAKRGILEAESEAENGE